MAGARPSRLLDAMLSRAVASRTENCCTPSRPGGIDGRPPPPIWPNALAPPSDAATVTPAPTPMNSRRLSFLLMLAYLPLERTCGIAGPAMRRWLDPFDPWIEPVPVAAAARVERKSSSGGNQAEKPQLSPEGAQKLLTGVRTGENLWLDGQAIIHDLGGGTAPGPRGE